MRGGKLSVIKEGEGGPVISDYSGHLQADQAETKRPESPLPSCSQFTVSRPAPGGSLHWSVGVGWGATLVTARH